MLAAKEPSVPLRWTKALDKRWARLPSEWMTKNTGSLHDKNTARLHTIQLDALALELSTHSPCLGVLEPRR